MRHGISFLGWIAAGILACTGVRGGPLQALRFEAEDWTEPKDAWQIDKYSETKWNLWSTDKDAEKKWSGGVVLQSPRVMADRADGGEGAPVLHTLVTGIPVGSYDIEMGSTGRVIGISLDGVNWQRTGSGIIADNVRIEDGRFELWVDDRYAEPDEAHRGSCYYDCITLYPTGPEYIAEILGERVPVTGWARKRREEVLDRGVVALRTQEGVYVGWRLLRDDPANIAFNVFRGEGTGPMKKLNIQPLSVTTDFVDTTAPGNVDLTYCVKAAGRNGFRDVVTHILGGSVPPGGKTVLPAGTEPRSYLSLKLDGDYRFQKIGISDLDGDGRYDYVIKQPGANIDPAGSYWIPSPDSYKIEAYTHDGELLWRHDLGWAIERGIWYSPYIVHDLTGDGRAEVAAKIGEGDPRDEDGRVRTGPEWLVVWDGWTGAEIARTPWPSREGFGEYSRISRNQMAVAYLDGRTPCLLALRGTYDRMKVDAYQLHKGKLSLIWQYDNDGLPRRYWGQGAHFTRAIDVDGDGRDEVMLGSVMLDDTGIPLWTQGMGHNDFAYVGDIDPQRPGMEIYYGFETRARANGMCQVDAATGGLLWGFAESTRHIHGTGMCADIDPRIPGMECFALDCLSKKPDIRKGPWLWAANGDLLWYENPVLPKTYSFDTAYWDADLLKEIVRGGKISDYAGGLVGKIEGSVVLIADIIGDWREEIVTSRDGELRIYSTTIPAADRRVCFMQDRIYRADITMDTMGYTKIPMTSCCLEAHWPGLSLVAPGTDADKPGETACRVVVTAPVGRPLSGVLSFRSDAGTITPAQCPVEVAGGGRAAFLATVKREEGTGADTTIHAEFAGILAPAPGDDPLVAGLVPPAGGAPSPLAREVILTGALRVRVPDRIRDDLPRVQAEAFTEQGNGTVKIRTDKQGVSEKAISHWDAAGHWLAWRLQVPGPGDYELVVRYCTPERAERKLSVDDRDCGIFSFPPTGGFGSEAADWSHAAPQKEGKPLRLHLKAGEHTLRLENCDGQGLNLDYLAVRRIP